MSRVILHWSGIEQGLREAGASFAARSGWTPNMDVCEGPSEVRVRLELAGVEPAEVRIELEQRVLVVSGQRAADARPAAYRFRQLELEYGPFEPRLNLPYAVETDAIQARFRHGLLEIVLPRARAMARRQVPITLAETAND
ncbi:MAG: Hsp20/alpha crystallin family protein [Candidatus Marinimicrobia bacterium]|nr:Hsp20/alpha crystallin family protein [Candidatus Neomarinimicrobiota bacterium]